MEITERNASEVADGCFSEGRWRCPEPDCGSDFAQRKNLLRHLIVEHADRGYISDTEWREARGLRGRNAARDERRQAEKTARLETPEEPKHRSELRQTVLTPLRARLRSIDRRVEKLSSELSELREEKRDIDFVLKRLDPSSFVASTKEPSRLGSRSPDHERKAIIRQFIEEHRAELVDGFTQTSVHALMLSNGMKGVASPTTVKATIEEMRDAGILRAANIVKGGGMNFMFVSNGRNGDGTDA